MNVLNVVKRKNSSLIEHQGQRNCVCVGRGVCLYAPVCLLAFCFSFVGNSGPSDYIA